MAWRTAFPVRSLIKAVVHLSYAKHNSASKGIALTAPISNWSATQS